MLNAEGEEEGGLNFKKLSKHCSLFIDFLHEKVSAFWKKEGKNNFGVGINTEASKSERNTKEKSRWNVSDFSRQVKLEQSRWRDVRET